MLSQEENKRYHRQLILPQIGLEGQMKLKNARVLVVGAGGLGCPVLQYLTAAGVGNIGVVDKDKIDGSNLQRQPLYSTRDIGRPKVEIAKEILSGLNPNTEISIYNTFINAQNAIDIISEYDIVVDGSDNFSTRYLVNDACVMAGKVFVSGSIHRFEGQLSVYNYKGGATYRCLFPEAPSDIADCSEAGVLGIVPGIIGTMMANEVVKLITGIGEVLTGKLFVINTLNLQIQVLEFSKNINAEIQSLGNYDKSCVVTSIKEISAIELKRKSKAGEKFQLFDLRETYEREQVILNSENISFEEILKNPEKIKIDIPVIMYCKQGNRSKVAIKNLQEQYGFNNLYNLTGGSNTWEQTD